MSREFEVKGRKVQAKQVEIPPGVSAHDLETGREILGPGKAWRPVGAPAPGTQNVQGRKLAETEEEQEEGEEKPRRGRPPGKKASSPPDL